MVWEIRAPVRARRLSAQHSPSGAYQGVFRNPLADITFQRARRDYLHRRAAPEIDFYGFGYTALFAFVGAMVAVATTYELARVGRTIPATPGGWRCLPPARALRCSSCT